MCVPDLSRSGINHSESVRMSSYSRHSSRSRSFRGEDFRGFAPRFFDGDSLFGSSNNGDRSVIFTPHTINTARGTDPQDQFITRPRLSTLTSIARAFTPHAAIRALIVSAIASQFP